GRSRALLTCKLRLLDLLRRPLCEPKVVRGSRPGGLRPPFFSRGRDPGPSGARSPEEVIVLGLIPSLAASSSGGSGAAPLLLLALMGGFLCFLLRRPRPPR